MIFFLHVTFPKAVQKATGAAITLVNISTRIVGYVFAFTVTGKTASDFIHVESEDWPLLVSVALCSLVGAQVGGQIFKQMAISQAEMKTMLSFLLVLSGVSLLSTAL